jgi:hypothetical protein
MSFWLKFVRDSNLSVNNSIMLKYSMALADRFSTIEELLANDENELTKLGITNQADRTRLIKQARLLDDKVNQKSNLSSFIQSILFRRINH